MRHFASIMIIIASTIAGLAFQNCTSQNFLSTEVFRSAGGGEVYDGKIFVSNYETEQCTDSSREFGRIVVTGDGRYLLVRYSCSNLVEQIFLSSAEIRVLNQFQFIYQDRTYTDINYHPAPNNCTFGQSVILHGEQIVAYENAFELSGGRCQYETRTCNDGQLSGTFQNPTCSEACPTGTVYDGNSCIMTISSTRRGFDYASCGSAQLTCHTPPPLAVNGTMPWSDAVVPYGSGDAAKDWQLYSSERDFVRIGASASGTGCAEYHYTMAGQYQCPSGYVEQLLSVTLGTKERDANCTTGDPAIIQWIIFKRCRLNL